MDVGPSALLRAPAQNMAAELHVLREARQPPGATWELSPVPVRGNGRRAARRGRVAHGVWCEQQLQHTLREHDVASLALSIKWICRRLVPKVRPGRDP